MTISLKELLQGADFNLQTKEVQANLMVLLERINKVREKWGKSLTVTSGLRDMANHIRIYKELAIKRGVPYNESKVPMGSKHLSGQAVDCSDPDGSLFDWCKANEAFLADIKLWMEEKDDQKRVHFQITAPRSNKRFFKP